ncbi:MAG: PIN domain-containing protein [Synechocystis sp.]|nr:PIN domain-containing protein [Synechocystis sp.]
MKRLFLDANVIFSAALSAEGRCRGLFRLAEQGYCQLLTSPHALTEAERNLTVKYPQALAVYQETLLPLVAVVTEASQEKVEWAMGLGLPLKDAPILAAAVLASVDVLVTGDLRHFGDLYDKTIEEVIVLTPQSALGVFL